MQTFKRKFVLQCSFYSKKSWYSVYVDGAKLGLNFSTIYAVVEVIKSCIHVMGFT